MPVLEARAIDLKVCTVCIRMITYNLTLLPGQGSHDRLDNARAL